MATHSSILAWEIPCKISEEPGRLQSMGSQRSWRRLKPLNNNKRGKQVEYNEAKGTRTEVRFL